MDNASAPVADWIVPAEMIQDPYPTYRRLREEAPVAWVPALNRFLVTRFGDCLAIERDQGTFSANEESSTSNMIRTMKGRSMLRKDDPAHSIDREAIRPALSPAAITASWEQIFERNAEKHLDAFIKKGESGDVAADFASPFASDNLIAVTGLHGAAQEDMQRWSRALIAGIGNVQSDEDVWAQASRTSDELDSTIDDAGAFLKMNPDSSMLSAFVNAETPLPDEAIRANIKLAVSGGFNEPSHAISSALWAMLTHPDQLRAVRDQRASMLDVFTETVRWISPVGMYPRTTTREVELGGVVLPAGARIGVVVASANHDERNFENGGTFDVFRAKRPNLAFGSGTHYCAGSWVAKAQVASVALPAVLRRLPGLRLAPDSTSGFEGWVFRGTKTLRVQWGR
ncbi:cytochrome P450 [Leifsonia kafniensis]|uniref:Cytochrome P450 n=2 Tax=Leifsonia kafniensis TaxID=475957 RepID=A0ABP7KN34_9MICO